MNIYIGTRQSGKTTKLIQLSAETGATIAAATPQMARYIAYMANQMGLKIPEPVPYSVMLNNAYCFEKPTRYLVDEAQMLFDMLCVDAVTIAMDGNLHELKGVETNGGNL